METSQIKAYAAYVNDKQIRKSSSSGGLFSAFAQQILAGDGVVYGVALSEDCRCAEYIRVTDFEGLERIRGSKYIQAKPGDSFVKVKEDLNNGLRVLFSGTACYINALNKFLGKAYDNLICVDVICHGVASPLVWEKYVCREEQLAGSKIVDADFRSKEKGWTNFGLKRIFDNENKELSTINSDPFLLLYLRNLILRPSCYSCQAKTLKLSDITIGDFWGIEKVIPEYGDDKGVSAVLIRTAKGEKIWKEIEKAITFKEVEYRDVTKRNSNEFQSVEMPLNRESFFDEISKSNYLDVANKYAIPDKRSIKIVIKAWIKKRIYKGYSVWKQK